MNTIERIPEDTAKLMREIGSSARSAARVLATASTDQKNLALTHAASALRKSAPVILEANARDIAAAEGANRPASFIDRLKLDAKRIEAIAQGLDDIATLADPIGTCLLYTSPSPRD